MYFTSQTASASLLLSLLRLAYSIPCHQIGVGPGGYTDDGIKYDTMDPASKGYPVKPGAVIHPWIDPFSGAVEIVKSEDCFLRFQSTNHASNTATDFGQKLQAARITQATWTTSQSQVDATIINYTGGAVNQPLWLTGGSEPYQYTGLLTAPEINMAQPGLADPFVVVTYLLPSGVSKITTVESSGMEDGETSPRLQSVMAVGIKGISGTVDPNNDYAYTTVGALAGGLCNRFQACNFPKNLRWASDGPYVAATKGNGDCVVIDFRTVPSYMRYTNRQEDSPMCNWNPSR